MLIVVLVAPLVAISASPWAADTGLFYAGMVPAVMGLLIGTRAALVANVLVPAWPRPSCWPWGTGSSPPVAVPDRHPGDHQRYPPFVLCGGVRLVRWNILLRSTCEGT